MEKKRRSKTRANGTGTAFWNGHSWTARVVDHWKPSKDGSYKVPSYLSKSGFSSRTAALKYCQTLKDDAKKEAVKTLKDVYDEWETDYSPRIGKSTLAGYKSAYKHFERLAFLNIRDITAGDLQDCMDACPAGKRTHQLMKVTAGLLWAYAKDHRYVSEDVTDNLYTGKGKSEQRKPITDIEVERIRQAIGHERYAEYIYCLCYLGFRPGEFLALKKDAYQEVKDVAILVGGSKTDAGTDRTVVIPPQILDYVRTRLFIPGTDLLFPMYVFNHHKPDKPFVRFKAMTDDYFRETVFRPLMTRLGNDPKKVPYCARHTYSDKLKRAGGTDKAKAELIGHTDYGFTQQRYQSTDLDDLVAVVSTIK